MVKNSKRSSDNDTIMPKDYAQTLSDLKNQVQEAQIKALLAANKELIKLYWNIGKAIAERQVSSGLGLDLQSLFPRITGFSRANIFRM